MSLLRKIATDGAAIMSYGRQFHIAGATDGAAIMSYGRQFHIAGATDGAAIMSYDRQFHIAGAIQREARNPIFVWDERFELPVIG